MTHAELVDRAAYWLRNTMRCGVVLTERQAGGEIPDAIGWGKDALVIECKVSRADFFADAKKPHRLHGMGSLRYFMTEPGLVKVSEVPNGWGLLEAGARIVRRAASASVLNSRDRDAELRLVLSELRRYQLHGIVYPPLPDGSMSGVVPGFHKNEAADHGLNASPSRA